MGHLFLPENEKKLIRGKPERLKTTGLVFHHRRISHQKLLDTVEFRSLHIWST